MLLMLQSHKGNRFLKTSAISLVLKKNLCKNCIHFPYVDFLFFLLIWNSEIMSKENYKSLSLYLLFSLCSSHPPFFLAI